MKVMMVIHMMKVINHSNYAGCRGSILLRAFVKLNQVTFIVVSYDLIILHQAKSKQIKLN